VEGALSRAADDIVWRLTPLKEPPHPTKGSLDGAEDKSTRGTPPPTNRIIDIRHTMKITNRSVIPFSSIVYQQKQSALSKEPMNRENFAPYDAGF
jgi:hypothetical protein